MSRELVVLPWPAVGRTTFSCCQRGRRHVTSFCFCANFSGFSRGDSVRFFLFCERTPDCKRDCGCLSNINAFICRSPPTPWGAKTDFPISRVRLKPVAKVHLFFDASSFKRALFVERGELPQLSLQLDPGLHAATHLALGSFRHIIAGSLSTLPAVADV